MTVTPTIETGLRRLTREVLGLDQKPDEIDTSVKTKKPQVLWHLVETTLHPQIQDVLDALMEKLTIEEWVMAKCVYRTQMQYPSRETQGACCHPFGASAAIDAIGKTPPIYGEDGAFLVWRRRDCCQGQSLL